MSMSEESAVEFPKNEDLAPLEPPAPYSKRDAMLVLATAAAGYLFIDFVMFGGLGLGVTVFSLLFFAMSYTWLRFYGIKPPAISYAYLTVGIALAAYFAVYDNLTLKLVALPLLMLTAVYYVASAGGGRAENKLGSFLLIDLLDWLFAVPFKNFTVPSKIIKERSKLKPGAGKGLGQLLGGAALIAPVTILVVVMLSEVDYEFLSLLANLWPSWDFFTIFKVLLSIPVAFYFYGLIFGGQGRPRRTLESAAKALESIRVMPWLFTVGATAPLLIVYILFFYSQSGYFLSALAGKLPVGWSYAEYARRGFFELCTVSGINLGVISALVFCTKKGGGKDAPCRFLSILFALLSIALVVMSLSKMLLYIGCYGLTPKRLYTSVFMVFLAIVFALLIVKSVFSGFNCARWITVSLLAVFLIFCASNPDYQIARHNVERYKSGELNSLDIYLLCSLDSSATPYIIEAYNMGSLSKSDREQFEMRFLLYERDLSWKAENLARFRAKQILDKTPKRLSSEFDRRFLLNSCAEH